MYKLLLFFVIFNITALAIANDIRGKVVFVDDGDTIIIVSESGKQRVRLSNIDAPESTQEYGSEAKDVLKRLVLNERVDVDYNESDKYGRIIGTVYLDGNNVNYFMVYNGHAWAYRKYLTDVNYLAAEDHAKKRKLGLWKSDSPIQPELYRKYHKH